MLSSSASSSSNELQLAIQEANKVTTTTNPFETSVKLRVLRRIVVTSQKLNERVVVVSGWTSTLDVIEKALTTASPGLRFTRLDGTTPSHKRTQLVTSFNNGLGGSVFLLSRKAGGVGLNLIGANRLVLSIATGTRERFASNRSHPSRWTNEEHLHLSFIDFVHFGGENIPATVSKRRVGSIYGFCMR